MDDKFPWVVIDGHITVLCLTWQEAKDTQAIYPGSSIDRNPRYSILWETPEPDLPPVSPPFQVSINT